MPKVKELMESQAITVRELAKRTGLSNESVMRARDERIESCSLRTLSAIAGGLGVKIKDLFDED